MSVVPQIRLTPPPNDYGVWMLWEYYSPPPGLENQEIALWRYGWDKVIRLKRRDMHPATNIYGLWWLDESVVKQPAKETLTY